MYPEIQIFLQSIFILAKVERTLHADLRQPLRGLAAGQSVVVYGGDDGRRVLAQATIA